MHGKSTVTLRCDGKMCHVTVQCGYMAQPASQSWAAVRSGYVVPDHDHRLASLREFMHRECMHERPNLREHLIHIILVNMNFLFEEIE